MIILFSVGTGLSTNTWTTRVQFENGQFLLWIIEPWYLFLMDSSIFSAIANQGKHFNENLDEFEQEFGEKVAGESNEQR